MSSGLPGALIKTCTSILVVNRSFACAAFGPRILGFMGPIELLFLSHTHTIIDGNLTLLVINDVIDVKRETLAVFSDDVLSLKEASMRTRGDDASTDLPQRH